MRGKRIGVLAAATALLAIGFGGAASAAEQDCTTETTGWVLESPGKDWVKVAERVVIDKQGTPDTYTPWEDQGEPVQTDDKVAPGANSDTVRWVFVGTTPGEGTVTTYQHYSLKGNSGIEKDEVPVFPADYWQANTKKEPHYQGAATPAQQPDGSPYVDGESGLHYTSHGSSGKRDWFYLEVIEVEDVDYLWQKQVREFVPGEDAVKHFEYKYQLTTCVDKPDEPKGNPNPPNDDNPGNPPVPPQAELPHTGAGSAGALALLGTSLIGLGTLLYRKFAL